MCMNFYFDMPHLFPETLCYMLGSVPESLLFDKIVLFLKDYLSCNVCMSFFYTFMVFYKVICIF